MRISYEVLNLSMVKTLDQGNVDRLVFAATMNKWNSEKREVYLESPVIWV